MKKKIMDIVLYSPCNAQSQVEYLGNPRMLLITIKGLCFQYLTLAEKSWNYSWYSEKASTNANQGLQWSFNWIVSGPTKLLLESTFSLQKGSFCCIMKDKSDNTDNMISLCWYPFKFRWNLVKASTANYGYGHEDEIAVCNRVGKLDCNGYVQKRLGTGLRELKRRRKI